MWPLRTLFARHLDRTPPPAAAPAAPQLADVRRGPATILVADDDDVVRNTVRAALKKFGYRVLEASSGVDAVLIAAGEEGPIDMVLADVIMPSLTTDELQSRLRALRPKTPIAFMSGYIHDDGVRHYVVHGPQAFLEKPFSLAQLAQTVRSVLDGRAN
jgi:CheY-like chemotaxis protein